MARTADHNAVSPTAHSGKRWFAQPESEAAVVLTPDGQRWLMARAARLATEPNEAGWADEGYVHGMAELAALNSVLGQAITTEKLPPELPGVVELGDEVLVEFAAGETERFLLVDPVEAPLDDVRISIESPLAQALLGRRVDEQVEVEAPAGRYRCRILATGRHGPATGPAPTAVSPDEEGGIGGGRSLPHWEDPP
jgi:transcription elongation factor GreA